MRSSVLTALSLLLLPTFIIAQSSISTIPAISQITDGQIQAPTTSAIPSGPGPEIISTTLPFVSSTTTIPYSNPFTSYLSMTDSLGVVTGMPSVVTSQPVSPTLGRVSGFVYGNSTAGAGMTTMVESRTGGVGGQPTTAASGSATLGVSTGGAEMTRLAGCGVALMVLGVGFSLL